MTITHSRNVQTWAQKEPKTGLENCSSPPPFRQA